MRCAQQKRPYARARARLVQADSGSALATYLPEVNRKRSANLQPTRHTGRCVVWIELIIAHPLPAANSLLTSTYSHLKIILNKKWIAPVFVKK